MSSINQFNLSGLAGRDAEMFYTEKGTAVCKFSLALSEYTGKNADGTANYTTTWFNIVAWGTLAETVNNFVHKGSMYYVSGKLSLKPYTDKQGIQRTAIEVVAREVIPLGQPGKAQAPTEQPQAQTTRSTQKPTTTRTQQQQPQPTRQARGTIQNIPELDAIEADL